MERPWEPYPSPWAVFDIGDDRHTCSAKEVMTDSVGFNSKLKKPVLFDLKPSHCGGFVKTFGDHVFSRLEGEGDSVVFSKLDPWSLEDRKHG